MKKVKMKITVGDKKFTTKKALKEYVKQLIAQIGVGIIDEVEHFTFFSEFARRHHEYDTKAGPGIKSFELRRNIVDKKTLVMWINRIDGTEIDISYNKCVSGLSQSTNAKLRHALRESVVEQISTFRQKALRDGSDCRICEEAIDGPGEVDHVTPFESLVRSFLKEHPSTPPTVFDDHPTKHMAMFKTDAAEYRKKWTEFHAENSVLALLCVTCHAEKTKKNQKENIGD